jgi:RHS repeat-associated protein
VGGPTGAVYYYYDIAGNLIGEGNATAIQREYIWLPQDAGDTGPSALPLALVTAVTGTPVISMVHADHLNRPIRMTSSAKATVWSATWKPFGEPYALSGTIENNLRFPGQYFLIETGQAYNWHRTYDPTTGQYTQADPLRFVDGPSVYAYVRSSPYNSTDRLGLTTPTTGSPNGVIRVSTSTVRVFGPDGKALIDFDYPGTHFLLECHIWNIDGSRGKAIELER